MTPITANIAHIKSLIGNNNVTLVAVTKTRSEKEIKQIIASGITIIAENRMQEVEQKFTPELLRQLQNQQRQLHFIGPLQTNKVKRLIPYVSCIQSVDSRNLAEKISKEATKIKKVIDIFLQLNATNEKQKHGFPLNHLVQEYHAINKLPGIRVTGLMCMGKQNDPDATRAAFKSCRRLCDQLQLHYCSMGMSSDYPMAVKEGANMVRIGHAIFE